jgi:opacity protein-like surface antigen
MNIDRFSKAVWVPKIRPRLLQGLAVAMAISASSGAFAQCTTSSSVQTGVFGPALGSLLTSSSAASGAAAGALAGALGNLSTAFQTQQGSAFVSAPSDPKPDQPGGGVWVRGVGGEVTNKFSTSSNSNISLNFFGATGTAAQNQNCLGSVHESFAGLQVGQDIARLNWGGWNVHVGTTAGYLASHAFASNGGATDYEVPFFGGYLVATHGRFFADIMVRREFYSISQTDFSVGAFGQRFDAHGVSVSTSAGYNFALPNNWFIEPSGGFIWSKTNVDPFNLSGTGAITGLGLSTVTTAPIDSEIGRLSLRAGTTLTSGNMILQPFASASVFSEFGGNVTSTVASNLGSLTAPFQLTQSSTNSTTRVGTYGQYSVGLAAQVANTGWLGFVRGDYRKGDNIEGWTANAGVRYQFTPEAIAAVMPVKAPVKAPGTFIPSTNWTGFYAGGFLGMAYGKTDFQFVGDPSTASNPFVMGALGGAEFGYNYQFANNWVLGVEGDIGATNLKGAKTCGQGTGIDNATGLIVGSGFNPSALVCENTVNWMATVAARFGYAWNRTLFYVKAGGAWADDNVITNCVYGPNNVVGVGASPLTSCVNQAGVGTNGFSTNGHRSGWLLGFGTEFDLGHNWSAKAEWDYIDFGSRTALASDGTTTLRDAGAINQVKIGVNYRFGPQAVLAKY